MISTKNPFPGMNPFLERNWGPVHTAIISFVWETIARDLPPGLVARPEERLVGDEIESGNRYRADVGVSEKWKQGGCAVTVEEACEGEYLPMTRLAYKFPTN